MAPTRRLRDEEINARKEQAVQVLEKDATELQLEKALFGDQEDFFKSLRDGGRQVMFEPRPTSNALQRIELDDSRRDVDINDEEREDLDVFFMDSGPGHVPASIAGDLRVPGQDGDVHMQDDDDDADGRGLQKHLPLWIDSDDERLRISLASSTRLRKLRDTEDDDIVSGTEYIQRLRRQYERLHPPPKWVENARKRRRLSNGDGQVGSSDDEFDTSINEKNTSLVSVRPLAELLRSAATGTLLRSSAEGGKGTSASTNERRKLQPETLSIQRVKDVCGSGPSSIDTLQFHPRYPLLLSGGPSSTLTLYHISPESLNPNPLLTSLHVRGTPLHTAEFCVPSAPPTTMSEEDKQQDTTRVFLSSRRRYFHTWSLATGNVSKTTRPVYGGKTAQREQKTTERFKISPCGRYMGLVGSGKRGGGTINVLSTETMQWICACRTESHGGIADFAWWANGEGFAVVGKSGEVSEYNVGTGTTVMRWYDEGAVGTTVIALGGGNSAFSSLIGPDRWVAVGSSSGVVNVYDRRREEWTSYISQTVKSATTTTGASASLVVSSTSVSADNTRASNRTGSSGTGVNADEIGTATSFRPSANRALDQLTTPVSHLEFSRDVQLLVLASRWKKNALRVVHLPSCTVYKNWPTDRTPLGRISSLALSPEGGYLAVGNEQGKIRLWQISA